MKKGRASETHGVPSAPAREEAVSLSPLPATLPNAKLATMAILRLVYDVLNGVRYTYANEGQLQEALAETLEKCGFLVEREHRLTAQDRIDLMVDPGIGVEVKTGGMCHQVASQMLRYADSPEVDALLLVTTRSRHRALPLEMRGKPCRVLHLNPLA